MKTSQQSARCPSLTVKVHFAKVYVTLNTTVISKKV